MQRLILLWTVVAAAALAANTNADASDLKIATFQADVTPPIGAVLCHGNVDPAKEIVDPLLARGIVLLGEGQPIVLCAMDWVGVGNSGMTPSATPSPRPSGTTPDRVAVHCLHQHDAPGCDFEADDILVPHKLGGKLFDPAFARKTIARVAAAVAKATKNPRAGDPRRRRQGQGRGQVASNRRVMGPDGKVKYVRTAPPRTPKVRDEPEGIIDPYVQLAQLLGRRPAVASLTYYATHPQSYYGKGGVSCDFPGLAAPPARQRRDRRRCTSISTAPAATSPPASTTTARPTIGPCSPTASRPG